MDKITKFDIVLIVIWTTINSLLLWRVLNIEILDSPLIVEVLLPMLTPLWLVVGCGAIFATILIILLPILWLVGEIE